MGKGLGLLNTVIGNESLKGEGMSVRYCPQCGAPVSSIGAEFCARCGQRLSTAISSTWSTETQLGASAATTTLTSAAEVHPARRPLWLVAGLTIATFGLYWYWWLGKSWAEMKREVGDPGMDPIGHALAMLVPIYGWFRLHAHFRILNEMLERVGSPRRVQPVLAVIWAIIAGFLTRAGMRVSGLATDHLTPEGVALAIVLSLFGMLLTGGLLVYGQQALNDYWDHQAQRPLHYQVGVWQWLVLVLGGLLVIYYLVTMLSVLVVSSMLASS